METAIGKRCLMVKITKDDVLKLGAISQITITEEEIPALLGKLEGVLSYAAHLKEIAAHHEQATMPQNVNVTRRDEAIPCNPEAVLFRAPVREENYFVVPMILKGPEDL
jgi:aspartyl/glutamyl-tRNA(Asn/Gln) amidotransferase C subunit